MSCASVLGAVLPARGPSMLSRIVAYAIALTALIASFSNARADPMDVCAQSDTLKNLIGYSMFILEPAQNPEDRITEDFCTITITRCDHPRKHHVGIFVPPLGQKSSDLLTISNNADDQLVICFESDPFPVSFRCRLANPGNEFPVTEFVDSATTKTLTVAGIDSVGERVNFAIVGTSDCESTPASDRIAIISVVPRLAVAVASCPEPGTSALLATGLLSLGIIRRHRTALRCWRGWRQPTRRSRV
jgi:hypothetical protein